VISIVYIPHPKKIPFEYSKITEFIYLGTNQCCETDFSRKLIKEGVKANISLEKENLDQPHGADYFLWIPVKDKFPPTQKQLLVGVQAIASFVDNEIKVYVHCLRGHGRSPSLVAAYFMYLGLSYTEALKKIRAKRKIHLTKKQVSALKKFERSVIN
jgi:atypical dual specificity phosphatase